MSAGRRRAVRQHTVRQGRERAGTGRRLAVAVAAVGALALAVVFLWPGGALVNRLVVDVYVFFLYHGVSSRVSPEHYAAALNVLAFVPLGWLGVAVLHWRPVRVAVGLVVLSAGIELAQAMPWMDRNPGLLDVVCNGLGAVLGVVLGSLLRRRAARADGVDRLTLDEPGVGEPGHEGRDVGGDRLPG